MSERSWSKKDSIGVVISIIIAEAVGGISALLSGDIRGYYDSLIKPPLSPPGWIFGVVWPILFFLIGIAAYLVYRSDRKGRGSALELYAGQLGVNFLWTIFFFRFHLYFASIVDILVLDVLVMIMIALFWRIRKYAAYLLIPYLLWLLFATYLNIGFAVLNS